MKYTITHKCGHNEVINLYGKTEERNKKIKKLEEEICNECYEKILEKEDQAKKYPLLKGSEKQINWEKKLRRKHFKKIEEELESYATAPQKTQEQIKDFRTFLLKIDEAKTFIECENSTDSPINYYKKLYKGKTI